MADSENSPDWPSTFFSRGATERIATAGGEWSPEYAVRDHADRLFALAEFLQEYAQALCNALWVFSLHRDPVPLDRPPIRGERLEQAAERADEGRKQDSELRARRGEPPKRGRPIEPTTLFLQDLMGVGMDFFGLGFTVTSKAPYGPMVRFISRVTTEMRDALTSENFNWSSVEATKMIAFELGLLSEEKIRERLRDTGWTDGGKARRIRRGRAEGT